MGGGGGVGVLKVGGQNCPSNGVKDQPSEEPYKINQRGEGRERFLFPLGSPNNRPLEKSKPVEAGGLGGSGGGMIESDLKPTQGTELFLK